MAENRSFQFPFRLFRSRSKERDAETDASRRAAIVKTVELQRDGAVSELRGLTQRMNEALAAASSLLENSAEFEARSNLDEQDIQGCETSAASARQRITSLEQEIEFYEKLLRQLV